MSRPRTTLGVLPDDLCIEPEPWPRIGRPPKHDLEKRAVKDGWPRPPVRIKDSAGMIDDFDLLAKARVEADAKIEQWAGTATEPWLAEDMVWTSGAAQREMRGQRGLSVTHFFNHQTHHRGQVHAMLTACGQRTGDIDLMLLLDGPL